MPPWSGICSREDTPSAPRGLPPQVSASQRRPIGSSSRFAAKTPEPRANRTVLLVHATRHLMTQLQSVSDTGVGWLDADTLVCRRVPRTCPRRRWPDDRRGGSSDTPDRRRRSRVVRPPHLGKERSAIPEPNRGSDARALHGLACELLVLGRAPSSSSDVNSEPSQVESPGALWLDPGPATSPRFSWAVGR